MYGLQTSLSSGLFESIDEDLGCLSVEAVTGFCGNDSARPAVQERFSQFLFQFLDLLAE